MSSKPKPKLENQNKFRRRPQTFNEFFDKKVFTTYLNVYGIKDEEIENIPHLGMHIQTVPFTGLNGESSVCNQYIQIYGDGYFHDQFDSIVQMLTNLDVHPRWNIIRFFTTKRGDVDNHLCVFTFETTEPKLNDGIRYHVFSVDFKTFLNLASPDYKERLL